MTPIVTSDGRDRRAEVLPASVVDLFDDRFIGSSDLYERYVSLLAHRVLQQLPSLDAVVAPRRAALVTLQRLAALHPPSEADPRQAIRVEQAALDPRALAGYDLADAAAAAYSAYLCGERNGEEILFSAQRLDLWPAYFSNENSLYAVNNHVGARAVRDWAPAPLGHVLELGGGFGSAAAALVETLAAANRLAELVSYRFTEFSPLFLRRGQRAVANKQWPEGVFAASVVDINRPLEAQAVAPGSVDLVYAVNTLHVAHDLPATLREIDRCLRPGGQLILSECVRPRPEQPLYTEFVFNLLETFLAPKLEPGRPNGGFLTPEQWVVLLENAGFTQVRFLPEVRTIRDVYPAFFVAAIGATRAT